MFRLLHSCPFHMLRTITALTRWAIQKGDIFSGESNHPLPLRSVYPERNRQDYFPKNGMIKPDCFSRRWSCLGQTYSKEGSDVY
jgi:hypothetical protein